MHINLKQLIGVAVKAALKSNAKTAMIADEGSALAMDAEEIFKPSTPEGKTGAAKRAHVLNSIRELAQAVDELKGSPDEVAGHVSNALAAGIEAANEAKAALQAP